MTIEMPEFPPEATRFTCALRRGDGDRFRVMFAPAGGLGWSKPCCEDGHVNAVDATTHGGATLERLLSRQLQSSGAPS